MRTTKENLHALYGHIGREDLERLLYMAETENTGFRHNFMLALRFLARLPKRYRPKAGTLGIHMRARARALAAVKQQEKRE